MVYDRTATLAMVGPVEASQETMENDQISGALTDAAPSETLALDQVCSVLKEH